MLRIKTSISSVYKSGHLRTWRTGHLEKCYSQAAPPATSNAAASSKPLEGPEQTPPPPPKKGGVFGKLFALTVFGASGVVGYAWYDAEFRKQIESNVPYSKRALDEIFQYLPDNLPQEKPASIPFNKGRQIGQPVSKAEELEMPSLVKPPVIQKISEEATPKPKETKEEDKAKKEKQQKERAKNEIKEKKRQLEEKKKKEKEKVLQALKDKEQEDAAYNDAVKEIIDELKGFADAATVKASELQKEAESVLRKHAEDLRQAMDMEESKDKDAQWKELTVAHDARLDTFEAAENAVQTAREEQQKLRAAIKDGRDNKVTQRNPCLTEAEKSLGALTYQLNTATDQLKKAQSEVKVMAEYRDVVKQAREQFKKELESVQPDVKIGNRFGGKMTEDELNSLIAHAHRRIEQLQRRMAEQQVMESQRIQQALQRQTQEDEKVADARVLSEEQRLLDDFAIDKQRWDTEARFKFEQELRQQLARQAAAHSDHLADVLKVQERELQIKFDTIMSDKLMGARESFKSEVAGWIARLKGIEAAVEGRAEMEKQGRKAQELWLACQALGAVVSGEENVSITQPLGPELEAIKLAGNNHPFVNTVIGSFPAEALKDGIHTEESLNDRYKKLRKVCRRVAMIDETGGTLFRYFLSYLQSCFVFTSAKVISETQDLNEKDLSTFVLVDNAAYCIERGDLAQAVRYINQLKGEPRRVAHDWLQDARLLLETKQATDALLAHASASGLGSLF